MKELQYVFFEWWLLVVAGMAFAGDVASSMIALTILPQVAARWQLSPLTLATLAATSFAGQVVGAPVWGTLADAWGRKPTFMASQAIVAVFGILTALSPTPRWLVACRALVGLGVGGSEIAMGLLVEFAPPPRGSYLIRVHYVAALGAIYVGGCAWLLDDDNWRLVAALAAVPSSLVAASAACSLEESPRWLASRGRHDEAAAVLAKIWMRHPDAAAPPWISMPTTTATSRCAFFCSSRSLLIWLFWGAFGVAYYGIVGLVGVIYKHDLLFLTVAPTSELLFTYLGARVVDKSRRATAAALATCGALALLAMELVTGPRANTLARGALAYAARGALFGAGGVAWILTPELAPTDVRASTTGVAYSLARFGGFAASFLDYDTSSNRWRLPLLAGLASVAALAAGHLDVDTAATSLVERWPDTPSQEAAPLVARLATAEEEVPTPTTKMSAVC